MGGEIQLLFQALGLTLVHFCWQGAMIAVAAKCVDSGLPGLRPRTRYAISLAAMLAMACAAVGTFAFEQMRLSQIAAIHARAFDTILFAPAEMPAAAHGFTFSSLLPWLDAMWAGGVLLLTARTLSGLWAIHSLAKGALPVPDDLASRFASAVRALGLRPVRIRMHPGIEGPFVVGILRSVVYLPVSAVASLSPDQLDAVLAHELEHIRRADFAWNLIQNVLETLFFYHPAVWWLGKTLREQRELACDDAAVRSCEDPLTYATALLSLEEQRRATPKLAMALNGHESGPTLLSRIGRILGENPMGQSSKSAAAKAVSRPMLLAVPLVLATLAAFAIPAAQVAASPDKDTGKQCKIKSDDTVKAGGRPATASTDEAAPQDSGQDVGKDAGADESPAAEATDADVAPNDFWSGLMPKAKHSDESMVAWKYEGAKDKDWKDQAWKDKAGKANKEWKAQNWAWVRQAQDWARHVTVSVDQAGLRRANLEALRQAEAETRRQAEAMQGTNAKQADELRRAADQMARNAEQLAANAEADAQMNEPDIELQARNTEAVSRDAEREAERQADRQARRAEADARKADAKARKSEEWTWQIAPPAPPAEPDAPAEAMPPSPPSPVTPAPAARPAPAAMPAPPLPPSPAAAPTPPSEPVALRIVRPAATANIEIRNLARPIHVKVGTVVYKVVVDSKPVTVVKTDKATIETHMVLTTNIEG